MVKIFMFYNTGFTMSGNVPDSIDLLFTMPHRELENNYDMRQIEKASVSLAVTAKEAYDVDYIIIDDGQTKYCYFVTGFVNTAAKTCNFRLMLDALTTTEALSGGSSAISGWLSRKTFTLQEAGDIDRASISKLDDGFVPSKEFVSDYDNELIEPGTGGIPYIQATVDLRDASNVAKTYTDNTTDLSVAVPLLPINTDSTSIKIIGLGEYKLPGMAIFDGTQDKIIESISSIRSLGMDGAVQSSYIIPMSYATPDAPQVNGFFPLLQSGIKETKSKLNPIPIEVENAKAALFHQRIKLMAKCYPAEAEYSISQIGTEFKFKYWADPSPSGHPYCRPSKILENDNILFGAIRGADWQNMPFVFRFDSGSSIALREYNRNYQSEQLDYANSMASRAANQFNILNWLDTASNVQGGIEDSLKSVQNASQNAERIQEKMYFATPEIKFAKEPGMQNFIGNGFSLERTMLSDDDIRKYDEFIHKYGEAVNEAWDGKWNRSRYDYLQFDTIDFIHVDRPSRIHELAKEQLMAGVRVWHKAPSMSALKIGGNN